jgi:hypothetical protein
MPRAGLDCAKTFMGKDRLAAGSRSQIFPGWLAQFIEQTGKLNYSELRDVVCQSLAQERSDDMQIMHFE